MTAHTHTTIVPGCYRCELSADEVSADEVNPSFDVEPPARVQLFSLWTHKRTGRGVMVDKTRFKNGYGVRIKHNGRAQWLTLAELTENYTQDKED